MEFSNKCGLPYFCGDLPRLLASIKLFSFPVPLVPQPLQIGIGTGAVCAVGGGIFGQILAASTRLFLVGCWDNFSEYMFIQYTILSHAIPCQKHSASLLQQMPVWMCFTKLIKQQYSGTKEASILLSQHIQLYMQGKTLLNSRRATFKQ